ncbi:MAG TPA: transposase [Candidatus Accumulibacter phosphatis]|nr:transposase [Candidatus Accumulibacter phosphatis]
MLRVACQAAWRRGGGKRHDRTPSSCLLTLCLKTLVRPDSASTLEPEDTEAMANWEHGGGFPLDASVRIEGTDRPGLERLLRHCARPAFALERWREIDAEHLVYERIKLGRDGKRAIIQLLAPVHRVVALADDGMESASWRCRHLVRRCPVFSGDEIDTLCDHLATALPASPPRA